MSSFQDFGVFEVELQETKRACAACAEVHWGCCLWVMVNEKKPLNLKTTTSSVLCFVN